MTLISRARISKEILINIWKYNKTTNPTTHLKVYLIQVSITVKIKEFFCILFPTTLDEL